MCSLLRVINKSSKKEENSLRNGSMLFEGLIASSDGTYRNPIRIFSANELRKATNNYDKDQIIFMDWFYNLYRGSLGNRSISVKTYRSYKKGDRGYSERQMNMFINDVATSSRMNYHKNVLKLLGCCLETPIPIVVYEFTSNLTLSSLIRGDHHLESGSQFSWESRLKIANEIANAVTYLHTAFLRPIVHRDIYSKNILLDHRYIPKLQEFGLCVTIPLGETHVETDITTRDDYTAPDCWNTGRYTEKSDVYSFGMLLFELLSGKETPRDFHIMRRRNNDIMPEKKFFSDNKIESSENDVFFTHRTCGVPIGIGNISVIEIVNPQILKGRAIDELMQQQLEAFLELTKRCIQFEEEKRPSMIDVAKILKSIQRGTFEEIKAKIKDLDKDIEDLHAIKQQSKKTFTREEIRNQTSLGLDGSSASPSQGPFWNDPEPQSMCITVYVGGAVIPCEGRIGMGAWVCDESGYWKAAFTMNRVGKSPLVAEAEAMRGGLMLARSLNVPIVTIVTDSLSLIRVWKGTHDDYQEEVEAILEEIRTTFKYFGHLQLGYVKRQFNLNAHLLAHWAAWTRTDGICLVEPPSCLMGLVPL